MGFDVPITEINCPGESPREKFDIDETIDEGVAPPGCLHVTNNMGFIKLIEKKLYQKKYRYLDFLTARRSRGP